jgi:hypothetical protein
MRHHLPRAAALILVLLAALGCGQRETPEQHLERLRFNHEIIPVGTTTLTRDGGPTLMVDLQVVNRGAEALAKLTVLVTVTGTDGAAKLSQRCTIELDGVRPGVGERRPVMIPGTALGESDEVTVEIERNLSPEALRTLPEWTAVAQ